MKFDLKAVWEKDAELVSELLKQYGHTEGEGGTELIWNCVCEEMLRVQYRPGQLKISGKERVHLFRGLVLFLANLAAGADPEEPFQREEQICFPEAGILLDCSRNAVMRPSFLKEMIRLSASCGLNQLYLYMEDVYEMPGHPYFGAYRGRYRREQLEEIDAYGRHMGVEVIPAIQTLAHLHTFLRWPAAQELRDTDDILLAGSEQTRQFVKDMIQCASLPFSTKNIHIGMDEAQLLGLGRYLRDNGYEEPYRIMAEHLEMVCEVCRDLGLKPMIWSDMFFRLKSPSAGYYDLPEETEFDEIVPLPEDVTLVYWDYYHHDRNEYAKNIRLHKKLTSHLAFAGGGWTWNGLSPNYSKAEKTITEGICACREGNIPRVICTFWFDNGAETPVRTAFYPTVYFAARCYASSAEDLDKMVFMLTGAPTEAHRMLDRFDNTAGTLADNENADNPSKYLLYQDCLAGLFDAQTAGLGMSRHYRELTENLGQMMETIQEEALKRLFQYYSVLGELLAEKAELGQNIYRAYHQEDRETMEGLCVLLGRCADQAEQLKDMRETIWFEECNPFGFEVLDIRLGGIAVRMKSAAKRLRKWMDKETERLEELEEPRICYTEDRENPDHRQCSSPMWQNIVSAGNIAGI